jgi:hypothetical protein
MAYRAPRYSYVHAARTVGADAITVSDTADTDFPKDNLIDDRAGTLFKWSAGVTNPTIDIDLGATFAADGLSGISRLIIPSNHNIEALYVHGDTVSNFATPTELHATFGAPDTDPVAGTQIDIEFDTASSSEQYIRVGIIGGPVTYYLPQLVLTKIVTLTRGPDLSDSIDQKRDNVTRLVQPTGLSPTVRNGPQQRVLEYVYPAGLSSDDLTNLEGLVDAVGMEKPFFVDPASFSTPPETDEPALWMKFADMPDIKMFASVPMSGTRIKTFALSLIESLD